MTVSKRSGESRIAFVRPIRTNDDFRPTVDGSITITENINGVKISHSVAWFEGDTVEQLVEKIAKLVTEWIKP